MRYDAKGRRLLATVVNTHAVFQSNDGGITWTRTPDTGVTIRAAMEYQGRLLAASAYNGLLLENGGDQAVATDTPPVQNPVAARP